MRIFLSIKFTSLIVVEFNERVWMGSIIELQWKSLMREFNEIGSNKENKEGSSIQPWSQVMTSKLATDYASLVQFEGV